MVLSNWIFFVFSAIAEPKILAFRDSDLTLLFKQNAAKSDSVIIYFWSPHMNLSVTGLFEIIEYGHRNKIRIVAILDPDANIKLASEIVAKYKWPSEYLRRNDSLLLLKRGARIHYPSYHFVSNGRFNRPPLPGYKLTKELDEFRKGPK